MTAPPRLDAAALPRLPPAVQRPAYALDRVGIGIVHLGPGAFHRAHQAWFVDELLAQDPRWAISAVALRSDSLAAALAPQDGLYTVAVLDHEVRFRVIGALRERLVASTQLAQALARMAARDTHLVTLTVTEKGYCLDRDGALDLDHPDIRHDLAAPGQPVSAVGVLVEALRRRRSAGLRPFTAISCDNLVDNGHRLGRAVVALAAAGDRGLADWIEAEGAFPRTMVDSIVPATDQALRDRVAGALGMTDAWPVQREAFAQWVVEDRFAGPRPDLAAVGVDLTDDVPGFVQAKLRLLNGAHSSLAYLGLLRGHVTVEQAMADPDLAGFVRALMLEDILPSLRAPAGLDPATYTDAVLHRFRNPTIRHELAQIAWDGSQKLPFRLLGTLADALAAGRRVDRLCLPIAAWLLFLRRAGAGGELVDPMAAQLRALAAACTGDAEADCARLLALGSVFPPALAADARVAGALATAYSQLQRDASLAAA